jgi:hypothetical protein
MKLFPKSLLRVFETMKHSASHTQSIWANIRLALFTLLATSVTGCGGGNSNDGLKSYPALSINGTAATGSPIANTPLSMKCAGATENTIYTYFDTTDANGAYSKRVDAAFAPCIISIDYTDNNGEKHTLSSYAKELETNTVANLTPLTNAVLSAMLNTPLSTYNVTTFDNLKSALAQGKDQTTWSRLKSNLTTRGIDTSAIQGHPVSHSFSADAVHIGTGHDKLLDDLTVANLEAPQLYQLAGGVNRFESVDQTNNAEVHDKLTDLIWQRCVVGKVWNGTTCTGTHSLLFWSDLPQLLLNTPQSPAANAKPWRLPTFSELSSLHDSTATQSPYIADQTWFPATAAYYTWTTTPPITPGPTLKARVINFQISTLRIYVGETTDNLVVRLVR